MYYVDKKCPHPIKVEVVEKYDVPTCNGISEVFVCKPLEPYEKELVYCIQDNKVVLFEDFNKATDVLKFVQAENA